MPWNGLERNKLDYILTDLLPVELSESFSFRPFYDFLIKKENRQKLDKIIHMQNKNKAEGSTKLFENNWATTPLKYNILKGHDSLREMSVIQPVSVINLFLFIELYQKDILHYLSKHHFFSIRYHKKSTDLFYKKHSKQVTHYFSKQAKQLEKRTIQQMGNFYNIAPFESINSFTDSRKWRLCNFNYKYYARIDYKSCFDSIYSHVYKWIIERITVDSKDANNSNLFIEIDRILQNINGRSSNGLIVGPEFSRMIAEILLQHIDNKVLISLSKSKIIVNKDYMVFRYVDDIFLFANSQENIEVIINTFKKISSNYLLKLNDLKLIKGETPCLPKGWLEKTRKLTDVLDNIFLKDIEYNQLPENEKYIVKTEHIKVDRIKDEVIVLMKEFPEDRRTIVSFLLSALLNNISRKKDDYKLFKEANSNKAFLLLDMALFIYTFCPSYDQTRKIISMIVYMNKEICFNENNKINLSLQNTIQRYSFIFINGNLPDLCDWFLFFIDYKITLRIEVEKKLIEKIKQDNNPIILANFLKYSKYNGSFFNEMKNLTNSIITENLERLSSKDPMLQPEFWYALIFHNCPYITHQLRNNINNIILSISPNNPTLPSGIVRELVRDFLQLQLPSGNKPVDSIFNWNENINVSEQITFRTFQRTIFKRYRGNKYGLYASIE
jgi:hypothetical protein